jgi:hypothetical protein
MRFRGINEVQEVSFALSDPQKYHSEALALAVKDAQRKAGILAEAANLTLGKAVSIQEGLQRLPPVSSRMLAQASPMSADAGGGIGEGMALGTILIRVDISAVFQAN